MRDPPERSGGFFIAVFRSFVFLRQDARETTKGRVMAGWTSALARGDFLHASRVRAWLTIGAVITLGVIAFGLVTSKGLVDLTGRPLGTDFISFWTAGRVSIHGAIDDAWDMVRHGSEQQAIFGPDDTFAAFFYPPVYLFLCWPLGHLPYLTALAVWMGTTGLACRAALVAWAGPWAKGMTGLLALLAFPAFFSTLGHGQNAFLTTMIFALGGILLPRRPILAGMVLGCLVYKPHMAVALPVALAAAGYWRAFFSMGFTAVGLIGLSALVFGVSAWTEFMKLSPVVQMTLEQGLVEPGKMVSVYRSMRLVGFGNEAGWVVQILVVMVVLGALAWVVRRHREPDGVIAAAAAATLLISPYMLDYDMMLFAVPMAWVVRKGLARGFLDWEKMVLLSAFALPGVARPIGMVLGAPIAPFVMLLFLAIVLQRVAHEGSLGHASEGAVSETKGDAAAGEARALVPQAA